MADTPTPPALEGINLDPEASAQVVHAMAEASLKTMRRAAYIFMAVIVILVAVGLTIIIIQSHANGVAIHAHHVVDNTLTHFAGTLLKACSSKP